MIGKAEWTRERISETLRQLDFGYQNVPLPFGLSTGGVDRSETAKAIFGDETAGKSVFDLGCRFGYFCFHAEERGAKDILGVDIDPDFIRKSRILADMRQSSAKFQTFNIETEQLQQKFDYVLCLNILHHLRDPLGALKKLIEATREKLVLEVAGFSWRDRRQTGVSLVTATLVGRLPVIYVAKNSKQTFFITPEAIKVLLLEKRADFARIDEVRAGPKGRPILIAHRRRIRRLVVVAGFSAVGKSTFIEHLLSKDGAGLAQQLELERDVAWTVLQFMKLREVRDPAIENVILHYNIGQYIIDGDMYHHGNFLADLISVAEQVLVITVACPGSRLLGQFKESRLPKSQRLFKSARTRKKHKKLLETYENRAALNEVYDQWFKFLQEARLKSAIVKHDGPPYTISHTNDLTDY